MLRLALSSQKYCGITPYYGSPTYHYLCMGMGMSVCPQIWEHFVDIDTMPHAMSFTGDSDTVTKINQVPYQMIEYNNNGMFTMKLMNGTLIEIFIYYGATPSILPLCTYNKFPILHKYPKKAILPYIQEEV